MTTVPGREKKPTGALRACKRSDLVQNDRKGARAPEFSEVDEPMSQCRKKWQKQAQNLEDLCEDPWLIRMSQCRAKMSQCLVNLCRAG
jgi:hypothetical protein